MVAHQIVAALQEVAQVRVLVAALRIVQLRNLVAVHLAVVQVHVPLVVRHLSPLAVQEVGEDKYEKIHLFIFYSIWH